MSAAPPRPKYQIFISSTYQDLHEEREAITWEILKAGHIPVGMENFSAYDDRGWEVITSTIDVSDYYVLLIAGRYGTIDATEGISWTEREYTYAVAQQLPVLAFTRDKGSITANNMDTDEKAQKLAAFMERVRGRHLCESWSTKEDLRSRVPIAVFKAIMHDESLRRSRPGWYRGNHLPPTAAVEELARLSAENRRLREEMASFQRRAETAVIPSFVKGASTGFYRDQPSFHAQIENHGEVPFRIVDGKATWRFVGSDEPPRMAIVELSSPYAKPGERAWFRILPEMSVDEIRQAKDPKLKRSMSAEVTVACENASGVRAEVSGTIEWS